MMKSINKSFSNRLKCGICNSEIRDFTEIYQDKETKVVVCKACQQKFAGESFKLIINLLFVYGGYFGMYQDQEFSIHQLLEELGLFSGESIDIENVNRKLMHKALLYGYTPKEYGNYLLSMLDKDTF